MNLKDLLTFIGIMIFFYLLSSFMALSFNPISWPGLGRSLFATMGTILAIGLTVAIKFSKES